MVRVVLVVRLVRIKSSEKYDHDPHNDDDQVKQQEALEDLSTQLKPLLGDSGMMDSNLVGSLVPR